MISNVKSRKSLVKFTIFIFLILNVIGAVESGVTVKSKVKHKVVPKDTKQLSAQEIDPNISPNPAPVHDDPVDIASEANDVVTDAVTAAESSASADNEGSQDVADGNSVAPSTEQSSSPSSPSSPHAPPLNQDDESPIKKYCECSDFECNCCRDFKLPIVPVRGPGCARVKYLGEQKMSVSIKYGDVTLASRVISGKKAAPICLPLPGGFSNFCGRIYGLKKEKNDFKACLGLELRAEDEIEAALRVSCFKFGSKGLSLTEAEPIPPVQTDKDEDDYDFFGLGGSDDDSAETDDADNAAAATGQSEETDYEGFSLLGTDLLDGIFGGDTRRRRRLE